ncbi:dnaJ homolog subfamily C member 9-like [Argiope bruennichi]|uniref:dnaJ homolog subfamily C member 9-like n=1 Tax=Argiope bruennichi TaxID=94029 RepID=UPI0024941B88|nr:dnaJ homolog subfamily C member 9-like [Argiope bruennichi]
MSLIEDCERYFLSKSLYDVLSVENTATAEQLKQAYKKMSLLVHPDKAVEHNREECTRKFQILSKVHSILSDSEKRQLYDETGIVEDENNASMDDASPEFWENYWRALFPRITISAIEKFLANYKGSDEEKEDLKNAYMKAKGDMDKISEIFIGYTIEEEDRLCMILKEMIKQKEVPSYPKFKNESPTKKAARKKRHTKETAEAGEVMRSLATSIQERKVERERGFNDMIARLEAKYAKKDTGRKKMKN